jgi:RNase H-fold protein (predicted Holliday junction resolvase)
MAEDRLKQQNKSYSKEDIDALAAAIILQDYLEANYG